MASQSNIETSALVISELIDKARTEMITDLYKIGKEIGDIDDVIDSILAMDIENILYNKLTKATSEYANAHRMVLEGTIPFAEVGGNTLMSFARLNEDIFNKSIINTISAHIRNELIKGLQAGSSAAQIVESVASSSISVSQIETLINTTLNTYSRTITNVMMDKSPKNTTFVYIGPIDEKTRSECRDMASSQPITKEQILDRYSKYGSILSVGGGFNCRHKWEIKSDVGTRFHEQKEAERTK